MDFEEADRKRHPVETQWHYPIMTKFGYEPVDRFGIGLVRSYSYVHPSGHGIRVSTGCFSDSWKEVDGPGHGLWSGLEQFLKHKCGDKP